MEVWLQIFTYVDDVLLPKQILFLLSKMSLIFERYLSVSSVMKGTRSVLVPKGEQ